MTAKTAPKAARIQPPLRSARAQQLADCVRHSRQRPDPDITRELQIGACAGELMDIGEQLTLLAELLSPRDDGRELNLSFAATSNLSLQLSQMAERCLETSDAISDW